MYGPTAVCNADLLMKACSVSIAIFILATKANAELSYLESGIGIEFGGCDYEKIINLRSGYAWECSEYGYAYHYGTMTVIQVNRRAKLCVGDLEEALENYPNDDCYDGTLYRWQ